MSIEIGNDVIIEYRIKFLKGTNKGHTLDVTVSLEEMEEQGLDSYLIQDGYFEVIVPYEEYYHVINRKITFQ
jgi:hypothetical protein